jgi:hypothetical protein
MLTPPDFDTRPGEMMRSTMPYWVQACPACGYCSGAIDQAAPGAPAVVRSSVYQAVWRDTAVPETARQFLCHVVLLEAMERFADAGWTALHAAWDCDDANDPERARQCRMRAIELWKQAKRSGAEFMETLVEEFAVVTDVCRRAGLFEESRQAALEGLDSDGLPPELEAVLRRQLVYISTRDVGCHSMEELEPPEDGSVRVTLN